MVLHPKLNLSICPHKGKVKIQAVSLNCLCISSIFIMATEHIFIYWYKSIVALVQLLGCYLINLIHSFITILIMKEIIHIILSLCSKKQTQMANI